MDYQEKNKLKKEIVFVKNMLGRVVRTTKYNYLLLKGNNRLELVDAPKEKKEKKEKKTESKED
jgi:hypothetical protein